MIKVIIPIISILYSSIILGKNSNNKAYLEGIKFALIYIIFQRKQLIIDECDLYYDLSNKKK